MDAGQAVTQQEAGTIAQQAIQGESLQAQGTTAAQVIQSLQNLSAQNPNMSASQALQYLQGQFAQESHQVQGVAAQE